MLLGFRLLGFATMVSALYVDDLDASNWEKHVMQSGVRSAFIQFTDNECGLCKEIASHWIDIGEMYEDDKDILVGSVDCTEPESKPLCTRFERPALRPLRCTKFSPELLRRARECSGQ